MTTHKTPFDYNHDDVLRSKYSIYTRGVFLGRSLRLNKFCFLGYHSFFLFFLVFSPFPPFSLCFSFFFSFSCITLLVELLYEFKMTAWRIEIDWDYIDGKKRGSLNQKKKKRRKHFLEYQD